MASAQPRQPHNPPASGTSCSDVFTATCGSIYNDALLQQDDIG
jgi:hypothetical protein